MVTMATSLPTTVSSSAVQGDVTTTTVPKKSSENRRSNKPIMEKRRRARINNCLMELKSLILDAMKKDPARHSKLEKADILEMTVKHLESLQRQQVAMSALTDPQVVNKFRAGFSECAGEVGRFPGLEPAVRRRLLQHLANCLNTTPAASTSPINNADSGKNLQVHILPSENLAPQSGIYLSAGSSTGIQLVPTRLPNGSIALVLPTVSSVTSSNSSLSSSPSPSSSSSSPPPLAILTHSRADSTSSATSSNNSSIAFDRLSVNTHSTVLADDMCHSPSSLHSEYSSPNSPASYDSYPRSDSPQAPLALVVREQNYAERSMYDTPCWRPW